MPHEAHHHHQNSSRQHIDHEARTSDTKQSPSALLTMERPNNHDISSAHIPFTIYARAVRGLQTINSKQHTPSFSTHPVSQHLPLPSSPMLGTLDRNAIVRNIPALSHWLAVWLCLAGLKRRPPLVMGMNAKTMCSLAQLQTRTYFLRQHLNATLNATCGACWTLAGKQ